MSQSYGPFSHGAFGAYELFISLFCNLFSGRGNPRILNQWIRRQTIVTSAFHAARTVGYPLRHKTRRHIAHGCCVRYLCKPISKLHRQRSDSVTHRARLVGHTGVASLCSGSQNCVLQVQDGAERTPRFGRGIASGGECVVEQR
jgi:hypothetical protein